MPDEVSDRQQIHPALQAMPREPTDRMLSAAVGPAKNASGAFAHYRIMWRLMFDEWLRENS